MLGLSNTAGYAILALGCMEQCDGEWILTRDIAMRTGVPGFYLSKILHALSRSGLIHAKRGYRGGFKLCRPASRISLMEVVEATEGRCWTARCLLGLADCSDERACPAHRFWKPARARIESTLRRLTLAQVADFERTAELPGSGAVVSDLAWGRAEGRRNAARPMEEKHQRKITRGPRRSSATGSRGRSKRK